MTDRFGYGEIGLDINPRHPCEGCRDYEAPDGCKSNGGCGKPKTNADRIRAMTDEELAATEMLCPYWASKNPWRCPEKYAKRKDGKEGYDCVACVLDWLKSPVEVANES